MPPAVEVRDVTVRFGDHVALDGVTLDIPERAYAAIIGPNGAGKSTLLSVILGLQRPGAGTVRLFGRPPEEVPGREIGFLPQLKTLDRSFPAVALELVVTGLRLRWPARISADEREKAMAALRRTGAEQVWNRPLSKLSGGELQRVYLARAIVRQPRIMVLDEPAAGMDVAGEADLYHILGDYQEESGATVLMITHDWEGARYHASHVLLLSQRVVHFGPPAEVMREENLLEVFRHAGHAKASRHRHAPPSTEPQACPDSKSSCGHEH